MNRIVWILRSRASLAALWMGVALAAASQVYAWLAISPLEQRLAAIEVERASRPQAQAARVEDEVARQNSPTVQLASFYGFFAREETITDQLAKLYDIAKANGLEMQRAEYRMLGATNRKLDRYQVVVPMQGSYSTIRVFITAALRELPTMSLDHVQFQRKAVGDTAVDGQLTFSFHRAK